MEKLTFSIIVPTYYRLDKLKACLKSLMNQTVSHSDYEIIIVDDGDQPQVADWISKQPTDPTIRMLTQHHLGAAAARNAGAQQALGQYLAFTDDDCLPSQDWLLNLKSRFTTCTKTTLIGGQVINDLTDNPYASASQAVVDFLYEYYNHDHQNALLLTSNNICLPKEAFMALGGFDTAFSGAGGEDREFCWRWVHAGHQMIYAPEVVVHHAHHLTLEKYVRQHYAYGRGAAILRRRAIKHGYGPIQWEPPSFYWNLLTYPRKSGFNNHILDYGLFALSQVANGAGYFDAHLKELCARPQIELERFGIFPTANRMSNIIEGVRRWFR